MSSPSNPCPRRLPDRVDVVYIHNVTGQDQSAGRYKELFPTPAMAAKLRVFTEPGELPRRLGGSL